MQSCGPEFCPDTLLPSGSKADHVTQAGPISIVYFLGPSDWFRDEHMTQINGIGLNSWNLFGIFEGKKSLSTGVVKLTGNKPGATRGHLTTTSLLENEANTEGSRSEKQNESKCL